jgi:hypothetical protein
MLTPTKLLVKLNCVTIGDSEVHHIQVPAHSTFADLKKQLVAALPTLADTALESFVLILTRHPDNRWLSTHHPEIQAITTSTGDIERLLTSFTQVLSDEARVADTIQLQQPRPPTEIHILAYSLGNAQRVSDYTGWFLLSLISRSVVLLSRTNA